MSENLAPLVGPIASPSSARVPPDGSALWNVTERVFGTLEVTARVSANAFGAASSGRATFEAKARRFHEASKRMCGLHGLELSVIGTLPERPVIIASNHVSYVDPLLIGAVGPCAPISKHQVASWPIVGTGAKSVGALFVNRDSPMSGAMVLRQAERALEAGVSVLNFPEGTTTRGTLLPFRRGLFGLAQLMSVPIVPVRLELPTNMAWVGDDYFLPHYLRFAARGATPVRIIIGAPIAASIGETPSQLAARTRRAVLALASSEIK